MCTDSEGRALLIKGDTPCKSCQSLRQETFNGEIAIHFSGIAGLKKPIVWSFPKLVVCLDCGFTEFFLPERELHVLVDGTVKDGAIVFDSGSDQSLEEAG
jgi:hypothetical protein